MDDIRYLTHAVRLAQQQLGQTGQNPTVAAILANEKGLISYGVHPGAGQPHAEIIAFQRAKQKDLSGATLYVTLEPCSHTGRTPPCTRAIIQSGVARVVLGHIDPNPQVAGQGVAALKAAGIECLIAPLPDIIELYRTYRHHHQHHQLWVDLKIAHTQDHLLAGPQGKPLSITGPDTNLWTQLQRAQHEALLTSSATLRADNPAFNARLHGQHIKKPLFVITQFADLPLTLKCFETTASITLLHSKQAPQARLNQLRQHGIQCYCIPHPWGKAYWSSVFEYIYQLGFRTLWCELGAHGLSSCLALGLAHRVYRLISSHCAQHGLHFSIDDLAPHYIQSHLVQSFNDDQLWVHERSPIADL